MSRPAGDFLTPEEQQTRDMTGTRSRADARPRFLETIVQRADGSRVPVEVSFAPIHLDGLPGRHRVHARRHRAARRPPTRSRAPSGAFASSSSSRPTPCGSTTGGGSLFANPTAARMLEIRQRRGAARDRPADDRRARGRQGQMRERTQEMFRTGERLPPREYRDAPQRRHVRPHRGAVDAHRVGGRAGAPRLRARRHEPQGDGGAARAVGAARGARHAARGHRARDEQPAVVHAARHRAGASRSSSASAAPAGRRRAACARSLDSALHGATRVAAVIGQIRASSRPEVEERGPVDVRGVLESALRVTHNEIHHRARLVTDLADVPPAPCGAARSASSRCSSTCSSTPCRRCPTGAPRTRSASSLRATAAREVVVEITDNGAGIPDDVRPRIFDPFFTTKPVGLGLGLGLSICHGIVTNHGGTITVESTPGRGTTFRVVLPAMPAAAAAALRAASAPGRGGGARARRPAPRARHRRRAGAGRHDPPRARQGLSTSTSPSDAREGLERLGRPDAYDVVLCDLMMPDMTGMDLYAEVARRHPGLERRFIFMTGGAFTPRATEFLAQVRTAASRSRSRRPSSGPSSRGTTEGRAREADREHDGGADHRRREGRTRDVGFDERPAFAATDGRRAEQRHGRASVRRTVALDELRAKLGVLDDDAPRTAARRPMDRATAHVHGRSVHGAARARERRHRRPHDERVETAKGEPEPHEQERQRVRDAPAQIPLARARVALDQRLAAHAAIVTPAPVRSGY